MAPPESLDQRPERERFAQSVVGALLGPNPFVGFTGQDVLRVIRWIGEHLVTQPVVVMEQQAAVVRELIGVLAGQSTLAPEPGDRRFQDPTWSTSPLYRAWMQGYLAWRGSLHVLVDTMGLPPANMARAHFVVSLLTEALAPTNFLLGNPAALKHALDTGGASLGRGLGHLLRDIATNGGMPAQVDKSPFQVGKNLAASPGAVVFRTEVLELIQYAPAGAEVHARPLLIVPPQINKFYLLDLAPGKSLIEYAVKNGLQVFVISWRNPTPAQRDWGLETYVTSILDAIDATCEITGSPDVNALAACAGGITAMPLLAYLAAKGDRRVNAVSLLVALLDTQAESLVGSFATPEALALARLGSQLRGVLGGDELGRSFAWLRPNDLVWNYWVNNYLMGNDPPAFDVLYWNNDATSLPARLHGDFLDMFASNPFKNPGTLSLLGTPLDLSKVTCDVFILAGLTDHIVPWKASYATTQMLGGQREFVLSGSGHVQSIVTPPTSAKARYFTGREYPGRADDWLARAQPQSGSWWEHWRDWSIARSGQRREAPKGLGSRRHPPGTAAPGTYVLGIATER
jgi:poly[(R)-3-hydroxyalkanoate] polymerase subunit PhaC